MAGACLPIKWWNVFPIYLNLDGHIITKIKIFQGGDAHSRKCVGELPQIISEARGEFVFFVFFTEASWHILREGVTLPPFVWSS